MVSFIEKLCTYLNIEEDTLVLLLDQELTWLVKQAPSYYGISDNDRLRMMSVDRASPAKPPSTVKAGVRAAVFYFAEVDTHTPASPAVSR